MPRRAATETSATCAATKSKASGIVSSFDGQWAPKDMLYAALHASPVADYLYINKLGFIARYFDDECLLGSERLRARALLHGADGAGNPGSCLLFAFEEVRLTLYILQVAAVVMQGRSYLEHEQAETIKHGKRVEKARERFTPTDIEEMEADLEKKSPENKGAYRRLISRTVTGDSEYHDVFRLFGLFFQGRQNLLKAVKAIASGAISDMDSNFSDPYGGAPHLNADEEERIGAIERRALAGGADPSLLSMRPYVPLWLQMEDDLTLFLESCITCDWFPLPSELIGTDVLKRGSFADGGKDFSEAKFMWPFQRAIASQLVEYLRYAEKSRQNRATPGSVEQVANKESWQLCEWCGEPFLFKNATPSLIKSSVAKNTRHRLPTSPYCCDAHRMSVSRSK